MPEREFLIMRFGNFADESRGTLKSAGIATGGAEQRIRQEKFILRSRDGDVEQPAFFFFAFQIVERPGERKHPVAQTGDKNRFPLLPFRLMHGAEAEIFLFATGNQRGVIGFEIREQRELAEKILDGFELRTE